MIKLEFPNHPFKIKEEKGKELIFDECRKRWIILTPEEWVRQNFMKYLVTVMRYPSSLVAVEREIILGDVKKRFDLVVFREAKPWMVVECKEMNVPLSEAVIRQVLNYNIMLQVQFIVITNGTETFALEVHNGQHRWLNALPVF
jgi:hypothetical protein